MDYQEEVLADIIDEMMPLLECHHDEVDLFSTNLNIDMSVYQEGYGALFTMRNDNILVGYCYFFIYQHNHHVHKRQAVQDVLFIVDKCRGYASSFIDYCDKMLNNKGCDAVVHCIPTIGKDWSKVLLRKGYKELETNYYRRL